MCGFSHQTFNSTKLEFFVSRNTITDIFMLRGVGHGSRGVLLQVQVSSALQLSSRSVSWCTNRLMFCGVGGSPKLKKSYNQFLHCTAPSSASFPTIIASAMASSTYTVEERGTPNTLDYKMFIKNEEGYISPFHDIPLYADKEKKIYNMVVEVPRWTNAKMEISTKEPLNPITQDTKKGKLRFVHNVFPHHGYIWNYGALPQTWEDPAHKDPNTGAIGDSDPIDVCEIGQRVAKRGDVIQVKVLGTFALIDEGETDWKLLVIDVTDPVANDLNDLDDIEKQMPGFLRATHEWFKVYKMPADKPENQFAFNGEPKNKAFAEKVIDETHDFWKKLIQGKSEKGKLRIETTTVSEGAVSLSQEDARKIVLEVPEPTADIPPMEDEVNKWHYIQLIKQKKGNL